MKYLTTSIFLALSLAGQLASAEVRFQNGFPVTRKDALFPLETLKVGDRGIGYTVFQGSELESFHVEILGVMRSMLGPGRDIILARLSGEKIEFTGVVSGMSGSPVYIRGRLLGAVSYRFGAFSKEPIAGITPISSMLDIFSPLEVSPTPLEPPYREPSLSELRTREPQPLKTPVLSTGPKHSFHPTPIETPIAIGGLSPAAIQELRPYLSTRSMVAVGGGATSVGASPRATGVLDENLPSQAAGVRSAPIAPGAPISVILMRGDLFMSAVGTVSYVEDGRVLGFGHPMFGYGHVVFPMATASILNTLAALPGSYKQATPALEVGAITHDRITAIAGNFKRIAPMVPVHVRVRRQNQKTKEASNIHFEIVQNEIWTPVLLISGITSAADGRLDKEAGGTVDVEARLSIEHRTLSIRDTFAASAPTNVGALAARAVGMVATLIMNNPFQWSPLTSVEVDVVLGRRRDVAFLESIVPVQGHAEPGTKLDVMVQLRTERGARKWVPLQIDIPKDADGDMSLVVGGAVELDNRDAKAQGPRTPRDLDDLLGMLSERREGRGLYAGIYHKRPGLSVGIDVMPSLPLSRRAVLGHRQFLPTPVIEAIATRTRVAFPLVVVGSATRIISVTP